MCCGESLWQYWYNSPCSKAHCCLSQAFRSQPCHPFSLWPKRSVCFPCCLHPQSLNTMRHIPWPDGFGAGCCKPVTRTLLCPSALEIFCKQSILSWRMQFEWFNREAVLAGHRPMPTPLVWPPKGTSLLPTLNWIFLSLWLINSRQRKQCEPFTISLAASEDKEVKLHYMLPFHKWMPSLEKINQSTTFLSPSAFC